MPQSPVLRLSATYVVPLGLGIGGYIDASQCRGYSTPGQGVTNPPLLDVGLPNLKQP